MFIEQFTGADNRADLHNGARASLLSEIIQEELAPIVKKVDQEAFYPSSFFRRVGEAGLLRYCGENEGESRRKGTLLVEEIARTCMTTAFAFWCHIAAMIYIRNSQNSFLQQKVLPALEDGSVRGGTGLSNPLKCRDELEKLCLKAEQVSGGYTVSGQVPFISNVGKDTWFAFIASTPDGRRIMAMVHGEAERLSLKERRDFFGLNGCATCTCTFDGVFIPEEWLISEQADEFVEQVRSYFLLHQIPLGLGVTSASIHQIERSKHRQGGSNRYLTVQATDLEEKLQSLRAEAYRFAHEDNLEDRWFELLQTRQSVTSLTLEAVHAAMIHHGGSGYLRNSASARRLREAYFLVNLTPTVRHIEKVLHHAPLVAEIAV